MGFKDWEFCLNSVDLTGKTSYVKHLHIRASPRKPRVGDRRAIARKTDGQAKGVRCVKPVAPFAQSNCVGVGAPYSQKKQS